jgi:glycosyltransferase involved in cell wall biosynthesis
MLYIEPTPYIVGLVEMLRRAHVGRIEVYYITTDLSQNWKLQHESEDEHLLPAGPLKKLHALWIALTRDRQRTILHLAGWGNPILLAAMLIARALSIPVTVESDTAEERADRAWSVMVKKLLYPLLFRLPNHFLPGGTRQAQYLGRFKVKPGRITISQMTVDVCAIRRFCAKDRELVRSVTRAAWGVSDKERIVLYVGRLERHKGLMQLLSAFSRVAAEENDLRLAIVGDGTLQPQVEALVAKDHHIIHLGRLSGDEVLRAYVAADLFVLPSLFEPWGLVVNEAMACGLPVIVSDRVGCETDLVQQGETGLIVRAGSETELSAAIGQLVRDAPGRSRMGKAGQRLISTWTLGNEARNIMNAWQGTAR